MRTESRAGHLSGPVGSLMEFRHDPQGNGKVFKGFKLASDITSFMS